MPNLYVISITNYDPFGYDYMMYTIRNHCQEVPSLNYDDGLTFIYFYTGGHKGGNEDIHAMLRYLADSRRENVTDPSTEELHDYVCHVKEIPEVKMGYMTMEEYVKYRAQDWIEEAKEEAKKEAKEEAKKEIREEARTNALQTILDLLEDYGEIPHALVEQLNQEQDPEMLRRWIKLAARAENIRDFQQKITGASLPVPNHTKEEGNNTL